MMNKIPSLHPARAAIAAVLAFGSTPLIAQTAEQSAPPPVSVTQPAAVTPPAPAEVAPPVAATPAAPAPAQAPVMAPPSPVVQPIPQPAAAPAPAPEEAAPVAKAQPAKRVQKAAPANTAPVAAKAEPRAVETTPPVAVAPVAEPAAPAPVTSSVAAPAVGNDNMLLWGTIGGVLLLGGAGLALLFRRRRPAEGEVLYAREAPTMAAPVAPVAAAPLAAPVLSRDVERPVETATVTAPLVAERAPTGSLEDMVARAPSRDNPFLTRKNRLRRAAFLMRQTPSAGTEAPRAAATITTSAPAKPSREVVYDFGSNGQPRRRGLFPATT